MKFIHVADIRLDISLVVLSVYPDAPAERLCKVTRETLPRLVARASEEQLTASPSTSTRLTCNRMTPSSVRPLSVNLAVQARARRGVLAFGVGAAGRSTWT